LRAKDLENDEPAMTDQNIIFTGVGLYLAAMLVIGVYAARRASSPEDFMIAGRSLPLWLCSATIMATWIGGGSMLGVSGQTYDGGLLAVIADPFGAAVGLALVGLFIVRIVRRLKLVTVIDFMEIRFGKLASLFSAVAMTSSSIGWAGALMVAFGVVLNSLTELPLEWGIIIGGSIVLIYTAAGGMWAVVLTDFVQLAVITVGLILLLSVVIVDMGGWSSAWSAVPAAKFRMIPESNDAASWLQYIRAWSIIGIANLASQSLLQRGLSAKSERVAQNAFYIGSVGFLAIALMPVMLGLLASVSMPGIEDKQTVIPAMAQEHLPPVLLAVFVGALLAAIMSSADSALLSASSVISKNILPVFWPDADEHRRLMWARLSIPVIGIIAAITALKIQTIYNLILDANAVLLAAVIVPFVAGIWWQAANRTGALAAMFAGMLVWLTSRIIIPEFPGDLLGMGACLLTMVIVTPLTQKFDPPRPLVTADGEEVELTNRLGIAF
jgi:SSS family solute:Na+ symporter